MCACTVDNPLAKARGLSLRTGAQTMLYLPLVPFLRIILGVPCFRFIMVNYSFACKKSGMPTNFEVLQHFSYFLSPCRTLHISEFEHHFSNFTTHYSCFHLRDSHFAAQDLHFICPASQMTLYTSHFKLQFVFYMSQSKVHTSYVSFLSIHTLHCKLNTS